MKGPMHLQFPVQRRVKLREPLRRPGFAAQARSLLGEPENLRLEPARGGLALLGPDEEALDPPVQILYDAYGGRIEVEPASVRLARADALYEPVMLVRVSVPRILHAPARRCLLLRAVELHEETVVGERCILRGEGPLARLLGLPAELVALADGDVQRSIRLSHYAPVPGPGGAAA